MKNPREVFEHWSTLCGSSPELFAGVAANYLWIISGESGGEWSLCLRDTPFVEESSKHEPDLEVRLSDSDFLALVKSELNPQIAFLEGKIKVAGDISIALRLAPLLETLTVKSDT